MNRCTYPVLNLTAALVSGTSALAVELPEDFGTDPFVTGSSRWRVIGEPGLFHWEAVAGNLAVTWDSARTNSFCILPLPRAVTSADAFSFGWDLHLTTAGARPDSGRTNVLQLSVGLVRQDRLPGGYPQRTATGRAQDLLDFSFFPLADYGPFGTAAYVSPVVFGQKGAGYSFGNPYDLADDQTHRIQCRWDPLTRRFYTEISETGPIQPTEPALPITDDFRVDALAIMVWNAGPTPHDSLYAQGTIDNVRLTVPDPPAPPIGTLAFDAPSRTVRCGSQTGYFYQLEASGDLLQWSILGAAVAGTGGPLALSDFRKALFPQQFYRVRVTNQP